MDTHAAFKKPWLAFLLLLPSLVILTVFLYYPTIQTFVLSLYQVGFLGLTKRFVGLENYQVLFTDPLYRRMFVNTAVFAVSTVALSMAVGLGLSILANQKVSGWRVYRLLLIWPYALSPAVAGVIFLFLFNSQSGIANYLLGQVFGVRPDWLSDQRLAMVVVILAAVWKNIGYNVVFYLAALQNLPGDVLEAALIDGATPWQRFWRVTFPLLSPMTFFLLIINTIYAFFDAFAFVDLLTRGGPAGATTVLIFSIYRDGFEFFKTGFAAAQSVVLFAIVVFLTVLQFRTGGRRVHYGG
ncbi:carbohydrate ABC transporter permease [Marinithermus hydrothermalis]|uniref:ABC-type transporter, integral membrane subunit n=1 Tax=Marinithermus hydrothermalis (strain DSM 14884 / JCM 11576 / T1) TaxID=869210 RepID=F2NMY0_MARHT|nr:ABC transporter permease subunit [Marinithermus hydrothermalis]AEB12719.1 ABC-type transporter, integral membrane subunit [Marinithermus hydrothermalis DSM 14884]